MEEQKQGYTNEIQQANAANELEQGAPQTLKMSGVVASPPNQIAPVSVNDNGNTSARTAPEGDMKADTEVESNENDQNTESAKLDEVNPDAVPPAVSEEESGEATEETNEEAEETNEEVEKTEEEFAPPLQNYYDEDKVENPLDIANNLLKDAPGRQRFY
jgi:hypothetical protein